jgi:hypothetical protein
MTRSLKVSGVELKQVSAKFSLASSTIAQTGYLQDFLVIQSDHTRFFSKLSNHPNHSSIIELNHAISQ